MKMPVLGFTGVNAIKVEQRQLSKLSEPEYRRHYWCVNPIERYCSKPPGDGPQCGSAGSVYYIAQSFQRERGKRSRF